MVATVVYSVITVEAAGQRIDNYLFAQCKGVPRPRIYRALRTGEVRINRKRAKPITKLKLNDVVRIPPLQSLCHNTLPKPTSTLIALLKESMLLHSDAIIVVNKPPGIPVHSGTAQCQGIIDIMRHVVTGPIYLTHRLDKPVSGCLVFASSRQRLAGLQAAWRTDAVSKVYHACVFGEPCMVPSLISTPLLDADGNAQPATSYVKLLASRGNVLYLSVRIETGRKHQIRRHLAWVGLPIIGDSRYGDFARNRIFPGVTRGQILLHAYQIFIRLPSINEIVCVAPYPQYFSRVLSYVYQHNDG